VDDILQVGFPLADLLDVRIQLVRSVDLRLLFVMNQMHIHGVPWDNCRRWRLWFSGFSLPANDDGSPMLRSSYKDMIRKAEITYWKCNLQTIAPLLLLEQFGGNSAQFPYPV
jgi:hypothetical protein